MNETLKVSLKNRRGELKKCPHCKKKPSYTEWYDGEIFIKCDKCTETLLHLRPRASVGFYSSEKDFHALMERAVTLWNEACEMVADMKKWDKSAS